MLIFPQFLTRSATDAHRLTAEATKLARLTAQLRIIQLKITSTHDGKGVFCLDPVLYPWI